MHTPEDLGLDLEPEDRERFEDNQFAGYAYSLMLHTTADPDDCERLFDARVPEAYALLGLSRGFSVDGVVQRWVSGVPTEYLA